MKRIPSSILVASVSAANVLIAGPTMAQDKPSTPMDRLNDFVGDGTCSGNVLAMDKKPGHATAGKYHGEKTLDGHWVVVHYEEDPTKANPKPFKVQQYFGYDSAKQRYVSVLLDNTDPGYATSTSPGWKEDSLTFEETSDGKTLFRDVFKSDKSNMIGHSGWMKDKDGKWVKTDEETCHKS
jgi:hypothetical protein